MPAREFMWGGGVRPRRLSPRSVARSRDDPVPRALEHPDNLRKGLGGFRMSLHAPADVPFGIPGWTGMCASRIH